MLDFLRRWFGPPMAAIHEHLLRNGDDFTEAELAERKAAAATDPTRKYDVRTVDVLPDGTRVLITLNGMAREAEIAAVDFTGGDLSPEYTLDFPHDSGIYAYGVTADQFTITHRPDTEITLTIRTPRP